MDRSGVADCVLEPSKARPLDGFFDCVDRRAWQKRMADIGRCGAAGRRAGRVALQRNAIECILDRAGRRRDDGADISVTERRLVALAAALARTMDRLTAAGRDRLHAMLQTALTGRNTLVPVFHLIRTAEMQAARGFEVRFAGLEDEAPYDLLLRRDNAEAEVACDVVSAEAGRDLHRGAWFSLCDRIDPDLQTWLADHPGRYLLKMTLPRGLKESGDAGEDITLAGLHERIRGLLSRQLRGDHDEAAVLRLDPLLLTAAQADDLGLVSKLRQEFGPEAHIAVTTAGGGVFALAARAGRQNSVACAVRDRMAAVAPARLTGAAPGILAMFLEDTDREEWSGLRERLELEGEARQFLTQAPARRVVAVTCTTRLEMFGMPPPAGVADGELRFRNPSHPAAKSAALAPAVQSSI